MLNKLIVLEGTDGAGKSTQVEKVKNYFNLNSLKYEFFHCIPPLLYYLMPQNSYAFIRIERIYLT